MMFQVIFHMNVQNLCFLIDLVLLLRHLFLMNCHVMLA